MRLMILAASAATALPIGLAQAGAAQPSAPDLETLRRQCPTTRNLAASEFRDAPAPTREALDDWQGKIRGPIEVEPVPAGAGIVLRAFAGATITQSEPSETATVLWRMPDGAWHFAAVDYYVRRPVFPPLPPAVLTQADIERAKRSVRTGRLDGGQARALERLLADPCLEAEPSAIGVLVQVGPGVEPAYPCHDGTTQIVEVSRGGARRTYRHVCPKLLSGDLLMIVLYPKEEGQAPPVPAPDWTFGSAAEARQAGDAMIARYESSKVWENVTMAATIALRHRPSGYRCLFDRDPSASVFGTPDWDAASLSGNCYRHWGRIETRTIVRRAPPKGGPRAAMRDSAAQDISEAWRREPSRYAVGRVRIDGRRVLRASLPDLPRYDARDETFTIVLGAEKDGWVVVQRTTGPAADRDAIEKRAAAEWRQLMSTRTPPAKAR